MDGCDEADKEGETGDERDDSIFHTQYWETGWQVLQSGQNLSMNGRTVAYPEPSNPMRHIAPTSFLGIVLCLLILSCRGSEAGVPEQPPAEPIPQLVPVVGLGTVKLIGLLGHPNELTRTLAHQELWRLLIVETGAPEYPDRLTRFHKFAPHACKAGNEAQTLHILGLFAAQGDISSILVKQCLRSPHPRVRATALELAHFSDNPVNETLLAYEPDPATLASYRIALRKLGTAEAVARLAALDSD